MIRRPATAIVLTVEDVDLYEKNEEKRREEAEAASQVQYKKQKLTIHQKQLEESRRRAAASLRGASGQSTQQATQPTQQTDAEKNNARPVSGHTQDTTTGPSRRGRTAHSRVMGSRQ